MQLIDAAALMHFPQPFRLRWRRRVLHFKRPAATSRGALTERSTYIIEAESTAASSWSHTAAMGSVSAAYSAVPAMRIGTSILNMPVF